MSGALLLKARICALHGCDEPLEQRRADARFCCPSHRAMSSAGKILKKPGPCAFDGEQLVSARQTYCSSHCVVQARKERREAREAASLNGLVAPTRPREADSVPRCQCGAECTYTDANGDVICIKCGRTVLAAAVSDADLDLWAEMFHAVLRRAS